MRGVDEETLRLRLYEFDIKELERLRLTDRYASNFLLCKTAGFLIGAAEVAHPSLARQVTKYTTEFRERGVDIRFDPFIGEYEGRKYPEAYTEEEIELFNLDPVSDYGIKAFYQKGKMCNAGYNVAVVTPNGHIRACDLSRDDLGSVYTGIKFKKDLTICPFRFCWCPLNIYDGYLYRKALAGQQSEGMSATDGTSLVLS